PRVAPLPPRPPAAAQPPRPAPPRPSPAPVVPVGEGTEVPVGEATEVPASMGRPKSPEEIETRAAADPSLAETQDMDPVEVEMPPAGDGSEARISFGQAAVNLKLVTPPQIQECVNVQRALLQ